jgi:hypothetical protein
MDVGQYNCQFCAYEGLLFFLSEQSSLLVLFDSKSWKISPICSGL